MKADKTFKERFYTETDSLLGGTFKDHVRDALWTWVECEIKNVCDEQKKICAEVGREANVRNETSVYQFILSAPYPEGVEGVKR